MADTDRRLDDLAFSLVGPGRVGSSLASWLVARGARLTSVAGRERRGRAGEVACRLRAEAVDLPDVGGRGEELLLVAVSDAALGAVARELGSRPGRARIGLHTAGSRSAEALRPLAESGTAVGSFHPLKAFPRPLPDPEEARGLVFATDGDGEARRLAARLAAALGASAVEIAPRDRRLYHFAASLAAGGVVTLAATAVGIARTLGLPAEVGRGYLGLAQGALAEAVATGEPEAAVTGPTARGDAEAVLAALDELARRDPGAYAAALAVCRETLRVLGLTSPLEAGQAALARSLAGLPTTAEPVGLFP